MLRLLCAAAVLFCVSTSAQAQSLTESFRAYQAAFDQGDFETARDRAQRVYDLSREQQVSDAVRATTAYNLGSVEAQLYNREAAMPLLEESIDLFESAYGDEDIRLVDPLWELAKVKSADSDGDKAAALLYRVIGLLESAPEPDMTLIYQARIDRAWAMARAGRRSSGFSMFRDLRRDMEEDEFEGVDFYRGQVAFNLGKLEMSQKDYDDAAEELTQAIGAMTRVVPESSDTVLTVRAFLIEALERDGRSEEATEHCIAIGRARTDRDIADYEPIFRAAPSYPTTALYSNIEGSVDLTLTVTASGTTKDLKVMGGKNVSYFERAALDAARQFRYAPRIENGEPVDTSGVKYKFSFYLEN